MSDDEGSIQLSGSALAALQEFMLEQHESAERFQSLYSQADADFIERPKDVSMEVFTEDWKRRLICSPPLVCLLWRKLSTLQLSQFWYTAETAEFMARQAIRYATDGPVALISAPSTYVKLKAIEDTPTDAYLFEYDTRFNIYGDRFVKYDYKTPLEFANRESLKGKMKYIAIDPPYLEEDCLTKTALTVRYLAAPDCKILVCTGHIMQELVGKLLGARITTFEPRHENGLANEFDSYSNFEDDHIQWRTDA
ncbi:Protein-lysine N-methyltransferase efm5 [Tieghemiomyces parasiticus]|uniref:Protein-lysine N-methyltransferase EFM5 n=1 Tax=Tieghemiomyces parasiticus TaxID=78921 RepID=A0A9W8AEE9_9FUNG|nr:Protein-lysine N-methyltransferase efm5 [Tieghemiomyces parasiticus]